MTLEILVVLAVLALAVYLFATERYRIDLVALVVMSILLLTGILTVQEGISGFSNMATVTVGCMFVLSAGLYRTGAVNALGAALSRAAEWSFWFAVVAMMIVVGVISAFVNNTAAVAIFLPVVLGVSRAAGVSPSKMLMPLSFASILGGTCTLLGTSTNILVSSIAEEHGQPAFGLFEFAPVGVALSVVGVLYMILAGVRLLPSRRAAVELTQDYDMADYLLEIVLLPNSASVGKSLEDSPLVHDLDLDVLDLARGGVHYPVPNGRTVLQGDDVLMIRCDVKRIKELQEREGVALKPHLKWRDQDLESEKVVLVEAVVAPGSPLAARTLREARFRDVYGANVLAIRHQEKLRHERLGVTVLRPGDVLLVEVRRDRLDDLRNRQAFVVVTELELPEFRRRKVLPALAIVLSVVTVAGMGLLPIPTCAIIGCVLMVLARCITLEEAYQAVEWNVIILLAGVLTLGIAMENTGAAQLIASFMVETVGSWWGPTALVSAFFLLTTLLTQAMSNNATAALLTPITIVTADAYGVDAKPLLMAVAFGASASFMTPVGYQTNALVQGPGMYRFADFIKVGTPLTIICWILATLLIPRFWPF